MIKKWKNLQTKMELLKEVFEPDLRNEIFNEKEKLFQEINDLILETIDKYQLNISISYESLINENRLNTLNDLKMKIEHLQNNKNDLLILQDMQFVNRSIKEVFKSFGMDNMIITNDGEISIDVYTIFNERKIEKYPELNNLIYSSKESPYPALTGCEKNQTTLNNFFKEKINATIDEFIVKKVGNATSLIRFKIVLRYEELSEILIISKNTTKIDSKKDSISSNIERDIYNLKVSIDEMVFNLANLNENAPKHMINIHLGGSLNTIIRIFMKIANHYNFQCLIVDNYNKALKRNLEIETNIKQLKVIEILTQGLNINTLDESVNQLTQILLERITGLGYYDISNLQFRENLNFRIDLNFNSNCNSSSLKYDSVTIKSVKELINKYDFDNSTGEYFLKLNDNNLEQIKINLQRVFPDIFIKEINTVSYGFGLLIDSIDVELGSITSI